jgi:hypothetical protein
MKSAPSFKPQAGQALLAGIALNPPRHAGSKLAEVEAAMAWGKVPMQVAAILVVSLAPALKASAPRDRKVFPPCAQNAGLNEGRHRRRIWDATRMGVLENRGVTAESSAGVR